MFSLGLGAALAFFQWNGRPFIVGLENAFYFISRSRLYLWNNQRKTKKTSKKEIAQAASGAEPFMPRLSQSRLHELAWSLDIKERIAAGIVTDNEREQYTPQSHVIAPVRTARGALIQ